MSQTVSAGLRTFLLPDLGEGLTEGELVRWLVGEGDDVVIDQPVAEVETAKSVVEVPSPFGGTVATLHGEPGSVINVGSPLISIDEGGAGSGASPDGAGSAPDGPGERAQSYREEERAGATPPAADTTDDDSSGSVLIGYGTGPASGTARRRRRPRSGSVGANGAVGAGGAKSSNSPGESVGGAPHLPSLGSPSSAGDDAAPSKTAGPAASPSAETAPLTGRVPAVISPIVRRLARDLGVALESLAGTGRDGVILRRDVEGAVGVAGRSPSASEGDRVDADFAGPVAERGSSPTSSSVVSSETDRRTGLNVVARDELRGVRKVTAEAMSRSRREIPEATVWVDVDATRLLELRADLKATDPASAPSLLALIARFTTASLMRYPEMNSRYEDGHVVRFDGVNLGFAAQTERGLMVPSIEHAERLSARELGAELSAMTVKARDGKCTPAELSRGTFTLNNYGVFGVDGSAAIINYPEVAILGIGRIMEKPWVVNGELAVRSVTELTISFDHRVCDGGVASDFLMFIARAIENPATVLADL